MRRIIHGTLSAGLLVGLLAVGSPALAAPGPAAARPAGIPGGFVCDTYCDGRDPALAAGDRVVRPTTLFNRVVRLHLDDPDDMAWASIDNGNPGDEVWLNRSFDGGKSWQYDDRLGDTTIPDGSTGWRTLLFNVDDWGNQGIGLVRACGKAGDRADVTCTGWYHTTRDAGEPRTAAATALMEFYDPNTGLWRNIGWWNSANALTAIIDNVRATGMGSYRYAIDDTYDRGQQHGPYFTNSFMDDTGWWALAWVDAYDLTGEQRFLTAAEGAADYLDTYWDTSMCGGGLWWTQDENYKNAIPNELYLQLTAALHNRIPGDTTYLDRAEAEWTWFQGSGMITSNNLVVDGLDSDPAANHDCLTTDHRDVWSYNQGVVLGGLTELYRATGDATVLTEARTLATASTTDATLNPNGVLTEKCEPTNSCGGDGPTFKGAYVRGLGTLDAALPDRPYLGYLLRQSATAYLRDRTTADQYGLHWAGPVDSTDASRQQSAVDLVDAPR
jgi:predicted alpha-1,6-mannanase (GH76 family)